jgi:predicted permease
MTEVDKAVWTRNSLETLLQDVRYGLRQLRRSPAFAIVAVLTLALGIGANTAIFSVMNAVLLRFLPVRDPQELVYLHTTGQGPNSSQTGYNDTSLTQPTFEQLRTEKRVFSDLVAFAPLSFGKLAVRYGTEPEEARADMVSGNFFSGLGVRSILGRTFTLDDERTHAPLAVIGYDYWNGRLARNPAVLGQTLYIKGVAFTIVGVAAPGFIGLEHGTPTDIWIPLQDRPDLKPWGNSPQDSASLYGTPNWWCLMMMGRLAPGVRQQQALAQLNPIFQRVIFAGTTPDPKERSPQLFFSSARGVEGLRQEYQQPLTILMVMVGLVLVIACGNIIMLLLARNASRQREFSLRMALGGSRTRLFRQLLTESLLLIVAGGALGWLFALWATRALAAWSQLNMSLAPDRTVLLFTLAVSLVAGVVFGLAPLRSVVRVPIGLVLKTSSATSFQDRNKLRSGQAVVALQMSLCLVLLVGAGLLLRTLRNLEAADLGLRTSGLLVFGIGPQQGQHSDADSIRFYQELISRLRVLPGVESVTVTSNRIAGGVSNNTRAFVDGVNPSGNKSSPMRWNAVGPEFFHVLGIGLVLGRDFTAADSASAPKVVVVNQTFVERYLPDRNPLGHRVGFSNAAGSAQYAIVGVAANSKYTGVRENDRPIAYFPYTQVPGISATMHVELRTVRNPATMLPDVRRVVREFAPDLPLLQPMTQQEQFEATLSQERLFARLSTFFGLLAALLVATGLYGTLAYKVSRRTAEIGVRMALGAQRGQVLWMVLRESLVLSVVGVAIGLPLAFVSSRVLRSMLFGLGPNDPVTFAGALLGITVVALAAGLIPARRAASVDPMIALRYE